jgi:hypothetical protein
MKKLFSILTIIGLAVVFAAPLAVSAAPQEIPAEIKQCQMRHDLTDPDDCVMGDADNPCPWKQKGFTCPWGDDADTRACEFDNTEGYTCGTCCVMDTVYAVTDWIFLGVVVIAMIMIFIGAFNIVTAGGSPEKVNTGRQYIIFAAVGIIVALIAKLIPVIAKNIIGLS